MPSKPDIDPEFRDLLPPQTPQERDALTRLLLRDGCRDSLKVWKGKNILVDGHNRLEICEEHNLPYRVEEIEFADREAVIRWIYMHQAARRNVQDQVRIYNLGMAYQAAKTEPGVKAFDAVKRVATAGGVSAATVYRASKYASLVNKLPAAEKRAELAGEKRTVPVVSVAKVRSTAQNWSVVNEHFGRLRRGIDDLADDRERRTPQYQAAERLMEELCNLFSVWQARMTASGGNHTGES